MASQLHEDIQEYTTTSVLLEEAAVASNNLAAELLNQSQYEDAITTANEALRISREANSILQEGRALTMLGRAALECGEFTDSLEYYTQSLVLFEQLGDKKRMAIALGQIGRTHRNFSNYPKAMEYYQKALELDEEIDNSEGIINQIGNIGNVYLILSDYQNALTHYNKALSLSEKTGNTTSAAKNIMSIGTVHLYLENYATALEYYHRAHTIQQEFGSKVDIAITTSNIGGVYYKLDDYSQSLSFYTTALDSYTMLGNKANMAEMLNNIGAIYRAMDEFDTALDYYDRALSMNKEIGNKLGIAMNLSGIGNVFIDDKFEKFHPATAEEYLLQSIEVFTEIGILRQVFDIYHMLAELNEVTGNWQKAYHYHKLYHDLEKEVLSEEAKKHAEQLDYERKTAERDKQIAIDHAKHEATEHLLHNVLPPSIAAKMLDGATLIAEKLQNVSVLFADIVEFTKLSQLISAEDLVAGLDGIFSEFDALAEKHGLEKIKTIGDSYMVVSGAPTPRADHAESIALMAFDMMQAMQKFTSITTGERIRIRIGIHTGDVVAGVIGKKKFAYDLWGDAVNTASRMESHGEPGKVHITQEFKNVLVEQIAAGNHHLHLRFEEREPLHIKGKGMMSTYFLYPSYTGR